MGKVARSKECSPRGHRRFYATSATAIALIVLALRFPSAEAAETVYFNCIGAQVLRCHALVADNARNTIYGLGYTQDSVGSINYDVAVNDVLVYRWSYGKWVEIASVPNRGYDGWVGFYEEDVTRFGTCAKGSHWYLVGSRHWWKRAGTNFDRPEPEMTWGQPVKVAC